MAVVLGLGNPGRRYAATRHNVGWRAVERLAGAWGAAPAGATPAYRAFRAERGGRTAHLVLPRLFMNLAGEALALWRATAPADAGDLMVVTDDVYLPVGALRLRAGGSSGGHRGLESVERALGHTGYARLRIGVGAADGAAGLREHVLEEFDEDEAAVIDGVLNDAVAALTCWFDEGLTAAMNRFNRRARQEETET